MQSGQRLQQVPELLVKVPAADRRQAEEILPLSDPDDDADPGGEAGDDGIGNEAQHAAEVRGAQHDQDDARHAGGKQQAVHAVLRGDARENHDERARRPGDLDAGAAEQGDCDAGDDGRVDALFGLDPRGDRECHRERQRDHSDDHAGDDVARPLIAFEQSCAGCF